MDEQTTVKYFFLFCSIIILILGFIITRSEQIIDKVAGYVAMLGGIMLALMFLL